jgi:beta-N-acetylhexosaminidase
MIPELNLEDRKWVDSILDSMTIEECIAQMLVPHHPFEKPQTHFESVTNATADDWLRLLDKIPLGGICIRKPPSDELKLALEKIQSHSKIPVIVGSNIELGSSSPARIMHENTPKAKVFDYASYSPSMMAFAAANDPDLTYETCRFISEQRRFYGYHWTFNPVVDLNLNFRNPITNIRSLGDDAETVLAHAVAFIRGFQDAGLMASTAKHFPGDGTDERDQHLLTTSNHLNLNDWYKTYGLIWKTVIDSGVSAIMSGHIAFPAYEQEIPNSNSTLPATLSKNLQVKLLREELGFKGVIISDASPMTGLTSRVQVSDRAIENILAGTDMCLLPETIKDYDFIKNAVYKGRISEEIIRNSTKRILELKARLTLHKDPFSISPAKSSQVNAKRTINAVSDKSITLLRRGNPEPRKLKGDENVLFVNVFSKGPFSNSNLEPLANSLKNQGCSIKLLENPTDMELRENLSNVHSVFVNVCHVPMSGSFDQIGAGFGQTLWRIAHMLHDNVTYTCFGTPYVLAELPHVPNMLLSYGASVPAQEAVAKIYFGELEPKGTLPVKEPDITWQNILR